MKDIKNNNLKRCREEAGITKSELATLADISTATIRDIEKCRRRGNNVTRNRIVQGFNASNRTKKEYTLRELFPYK